MPTPPLYLDHSGQTTGILPDGTEVPLAFNFSTSTLMMKVAPYMPWGDEPEVNKLIGEKAQYNADPDEWFRGVWIAAPANIQDADYSPSLESGRAHHDLPAPDNGDPEEDHASRKQSYPVSAMRARDVKKSKHRK